MREQTERWRPVVGYEDAYEVSDEGRVRRVGCEPLRMSTRNGYKLVTLSKDGAGKNLLVHRLVLEAFVSLRPDGLQTRHLNGQRADNRLENLAWGTAEENAEDRRIHGTDLHGEENPIAKLSADAVREILTSPEKSRALAKRFGVSETAVYRVRNGHLWNKASAGVQKSETWRIRPAPKHAKDRSKEYRERTELRAAMWRIADECPHLRSEISALVDTNRFGAWRQYIANHYAGTGVATEAA